MTIYRLLLLPCFAFVAAFSVHAESSVVVSNPLEYEALKKGTNEINDQINTQSVTQLKTSALQASIVAEFTKIHEWEGKYNSYLKKADGYASALKASSSLFNECVRIFVSLVELRSAVVSNPQGIFATMSMNNLYMETASEMVSAFSLIKTAVATGGQSNMLNATERSRILWAINDKIHSVHKKLQRLVRSIRYYTVNDVWNSATAGMVDKSNGTIAAEANSRWRRAAQLVKP